MSNEGLVGGSLRTQEQADNWSELKQKGGIQGRAAAGVKIKAGKHRLHPPSSSGIKIQITVS